MPDLSQFVIGRDSDREIFETVVARELFDGLVVEGGVYEYILMLDAQGRALVMNQSAADGSEVEQGRLAGIVTERDFMKIADHLLEDFLRRGEASAPPFSSGLTSPADHPAEKS